ncbi:hypothetical protein [Bradyrhizobium sp. HKCCYLS2033]|uniref:hypothetical protein n=1 Tax=Bradyrhizobium sp. HKCCYLS2033 TaxID=3420739 RepID=UPI003EBDFACC
MRDALLKANRSMWRSQPLTDISSLKRVKPGQMIRVGSVWMPIDSLPQVLARFTKLLFCLTGSEDHPYSLRGSATGLKFRGQHLLFCCLHQIADHSPDEIVVPVDKRGRKLVSGTSFIRVNDLPEFADQEVPDVCAMYFNPPDYGEPLLEGGFFDIKGADVWGGETETTFLVYGYPTSLRSLGIDDLTGALDDIKVKMTATAAEYDRASSASGVHALALKRTGTYSSDGLSGGAVFHLAEDARGLYCGFAGIVLRGSDTSNIIHFMGPSLIRHFFDFQASREAGRKFEVTSDETPESPH